MIRAVQKTYGTSSCDLPVGILCSDVTGMNPAFNMLILRLGCDRNVTGSLHFFQFTVLFMLSCFAQAGCEIVLSGHGFVTLSNYDQDNGLNFKEPL
jgi:hypothetical protein